MTIGAVLIVKNEEVMLPQCLESLKGIDEIVIADTGSTDLTIQVARRYTNLIFCNYTWNDNYSEARNYAKSKSRADWIISIDADEAVYDFSKVREAVLLAEQQQAKAIEVECIAHDKGQQFFYPRIFKNLPEVFWEGEVHNTLSVQGIRVGDVKFKIGYSPAHLLDPDRSFRMLKKAVEKNPTGTRMLYYLGREYLYRADYQTCVQTLGKYVQLSGYLAEKADAFLLMSNAYYNMKMIDDARDACAQALIINSNFKEAILFMAKLSGDGLGNESWQKNADQWKRLASTADNYNVLFIRNS